MPGHVADAAVTACQLRLIAKAAALQTVAELRLNRSAHTSPQQLTLSSEDKGTLVDLYRNSSHKDLPGWKGPAVLLDVSREDNAAVVKWQG